MAKSRLHPQFFQTLVPSFNTHLTIPEDFFLKYIEGRLITELKSDSSDKTWKVNMSDRRLTSGWKEFAVANDFQIGDVVVVRYEGDMVIHVSNLGPNYSEIQKISSPCNNNGGESLLKKRLHSRTQVDFPSNDGDGDVDDDEGKLELHKNKKVKKSSSEAQELSSSSSSDNSSFVAIVTATNLSTDTLYLPQHFTSSNGLTRNCCVIVLTDGGERSWALDLRFNESSDTFYISQGWRNFCEENRQKEGGFFMFKLVRNGEILVLSFCPTDLINDRRKVDCSEAIKRESLPTELCSDDEYVAGESSEDECSALESLMELEKKKNSLKRRSSPYSSYSPCYKRYVTFTLPPDYARIEKLTLPSQFVKDNGINKHREIYLLDKIGTKWLTNLRLDKKGTMALGKGWKEFVKANVLKTSFILKLIWEDTTPVLSLCGAKSTSDREQEEFSKAMEKPSLFIDPNNRDKINIAEDNKENMSMERVKNHLKGIDSIPSSQKQYVTLTITPYSVKKCKLGLPKKFAMENDINKPGMTTLLGKDGRKQQTKLLLDKRKGSMALGNGWKDFVKEYGLKTGDSFTLELTWQDASPVFSLCPAECNFDRGVGKGCLETNQKKSIPIEPSKDANIKEENMKEESRSMEREKNHLLGKSLLKKPLHSRTKVDFSSNDGDDDDDDDDEDNIELHKNKKVKKSSSEAQAVFSSSSSDNSCFVALVTATSLRTDILDLPQHFTSSNGLSRKCCGIVLTDGGERSWALDLRFNEPSDTFYISQGWRNFCDENGQKDGDFFMFKLVRNGEIPVLSFCATDFINDGRQMDCSEAIKRESLPTELCSDEEYIAGESSVDDCSALESMMESEKMKNSLKRRSSPYSSYSPCYKRYVTFTLPSDYVRIERLSLPSLFVKDNGINKPGEIYLLDKNGTKWLTSLLLDKKGTMALGKGWKEFVKANVLKTSFILKLIWEDTTPVLSLCGAKSTSDREQEEFSKAMEKPSLFIDPNNRDKINIAEDNKENMSMERVKNHLKGIDSIPSSQKQFVTLRTQVDFSSNDGDGDGDVDDEDNLELHKNRKVKKSSSEAVSSSSSSDNSCFVSLVTAMNLRTDTLYLPQHFTSSNGFTRKCRMIVLTDGGERSWALDLRFNESSDTFYISGGWRNFCDENGQKEGGFFMFKLVRNGEILVLSFCPTYFRREVECSEAGKRESLPTELSSKEVNIAGKSSEDECSALESLMELEKKKNIPKPRCSPYSSYSPCHKRFVTFTLPPDYVRIKRLTLPLLFVKDNGINKHREIYLLDKNGTKWLTNLRLNKEGRMALGKGWKDFVKANSLKTSFTVKLIWEDTTPVLSLCGAESASDREQEEFPKDIKTEKEVFLKDIKKQSLFIDPSNIDKINKDAYNKENMSMEREKNHLKGRDSIPSSQKQFVTLTITPSSVYKNRLVLAKQFARDNSMEKPGMIYLLDTNGKKWLTKLQRDKKGTMSLGKEWKEFAEANDFKLGESFMMELVWEDETPMLSLFGTKTSSSKANEKAPISSEPESRDLTSVIENRCVTLALTPEDVKACKLILPSQFMKANSINKLGKITLLGENKMEWSAYLLSRDGTVALGTGWEGFCDANGVKLGESFTLEFICEQDTTPVLKFSSLETKILKCSLGIIRKIVK